MEMKTFKTFIDEALSSKRVHMNGSIAGLKGVARSSTSHQARFGISHSGKLHYADSEHFIHQDFEDASDHHDVVGYVHHNPQTNSYHYDSVRGRQIDEQPRLKSEDHPMHKRFEKHGITRKSLIYNEDD